MAPDFAAVERALLALAPRERAAVIHAGLRSLDGAANEPPDDAIDAAWRTKIDDRLEEVLRGQVGLGSFEATRERFEAEYPTSTR